MRVFRAAAVAVLVAACALRAGRPVAAAAAEKDLDALLDSVTEIAAPGVPGPLCVFGDEAFPVVVGAGDGEVVVPVVAAARLGKGRAVAFGHTGYVDDARSLAAADTAALLLNAVRWAAGKRTPRVGVYRADPLADLLRRRGLVVQTLGGADWTAKLDSLDAICLRGSALATKAEVEAVRAFVAGGGGLVAGGLGWGWRQCHPGKVLRVDHGGNQLLASAGIVWADGSLKRTAERGFLAGQPPVRLAHAAAALDALILDDQGSKKLDKSQRRQAATIVTQAARAIPPDDRLLRPRLARLIDDHRGDAVPTPSSPLTMRRPLARIALTMQLDEIKTLRPDQIREHPAASAFPGSVPPDAPRVRRTIRVDTRVPDWHSTGLYAPPGEVIAVTAPGGAAGGGLAIRIGAHSDRLWRLDTWRRAPEICRRRRLDHARTEAASPFGGPIYIDVPRDCPLGTIEVSIAGAVEAPYYVLGRTDLAAWRETIRARPAPWAELASEKVILTVPSKVIRRLEDPEGLMKFWDRVLDACAELAARPLARRRPERYVADVQISAGYMHSGYPIMTWMDAAPVMVDRAGLMSAKHGCVWGLFHEMGHNHQSRDWTFDGTGEVTVNLFTLYVFEKVLGRPPRKARDVLSAAGRAKKLGPYFAAGADFAAWKRDPFLALLMYVELEEAFGWETFQRVFAEYRSLPRGERPKTDDERRDQWMVRFSRAVGRDLGPFFENWGVPTSKRARASIAGLPDWLPERLGGRPMRRWTDRTGRFHLDAELIDAGGENVRLRAVDGREVTVPLRRLSAADRQYVGQAARRRRKPSQRERKF